MGPVHSIPTQAMPFAVRWRHRLFLGISFVACVASLSGVTAFGQQESTTSTKQSQSAPLPVLRVFSKQVLVDVLATDNKGKPITGLKQSDFHVVEDGSAQSVNFFQEHRGSPSAPSDSSIVKLPTGVHTNIPQVPPTDSLYVLLADALNTSMTDRPFVRDQLMKYVKAMPKGTRIAIFTLSNRLRFVQGFSADSGSLTAALGEKRFTDTFNRFVHDPSDLTAGGDDAIEDGMIADGSVASLDAFAGELSEQKTIERRQLTFDAFQQIATYLGNFSGHKNLIWLAGNFPMILGDEFTPDTVSELQYSFQDELKLTTNLLQKNQVSVFPVDASGLKTLSVFSASNSADVSGVKSSAVGPSITAQLQRGADKHNAMEQLAEATGGTAYFNTNDLRGAVTKIVDQTTYYYTIGFRPGNTDTKQKYRKIKIDVNGGRCQLKYRRGYFANGPEDLADVTPPASVGSSIGSSNQDTFTQAMLRGAPDWTQIVFKMRVLPENPQPDTAVIATRKGDEGTTLAGLLVRYRIDWAIDLHPIVAKHLADGKYGFVLKVALAGLKADGAPINTLTQQLVFEYDEEQMKQHLKTGLQYHQELDLPVGEAFLRAGVNAPDQRLVGATEIPLLVTPVKPAPVQHSVAPSGLPDTRSSTSAR